MEFWLWGQKTILGLNSTIWATKRDLWAGSSVLCFGSDFSLPGKFYCSIHTLLLPWHYKTTLLSPKSLFSSSYSSRQPPPPSAVAAVSAPSIPCRQQIPRSQFHHTDSSCSRQIILFQKNRAISGVQSRSFGELGYYQGYCVKSVILFNDLFLPSLVPLYLLLNSECRKNNHDSWRSCFYWTVDCIGWASGMLSLLNLVW